MTKRKQQKLIKKQEKYKRRRNRLNFFRKMSDKLNKDLPKSEVWFHALYAPYRFYDDEFNQKLGPFIPDIVNRKYKYVIEVDGSIHDVEEIKKRDIIKNRTFFRLGFRVFRVKAYDLESFKLTIEKLNEFRSPGFKPAKIFTEDEIKQYKAGNSLN